MTQRLDALGAHDISHARGFLDRFTMRAANYVQHQAELSEDHPVGRASLEIQTLSDIRALRDAKSLPGVDHLIVPTAPSLLRELSLVTSLPTVTKISLREPGFQEENDSLIRPLRDFVRRFNAPKLRELAWVNEPPEYRHGLLYPLLDQLDQREAGRGRQ